MTHLPIANSVDGTIGQPMVTRLTNRKLELQGILAKLADTDTSTRHDIEVALATVEPLLTGDLANVPPVVSVDMNHWLERTKHLGERAAPPSTIAADAVVADAVVADAVVADAVVADAVVAVASDTNVTDKVVAG